MMNLIAAINDFCWGAPQSILLIVFGLFLTIYFKNPFIKYFSYIKEGLLAKKKDKQGISGFASLCVGGTGIEINGFFRHEGGTR